MNKQRTTDTVEPDACLPADILSVWPRDRAWTVRSLGEWLTSKEGLSALPVYRYVSFFKQMLEIAYAVAEVFDLRSGKETMGKKEHLRHIGPREMMYIANQLYVLHSYGIDGDVLECGVSHGFSTCILSHACHRLGRKIIAADSFEGLPEPRQDQEFFEKGDYAASLKSVQQTISYLGAPEAVEYIKGFYSDSLQEFCRPLCMVWLDVDLYESARDVMNHVLDSLHRSGMIFCHEFTDFHDRVHNRDAHMPPNAVYDVIDRSGITYQAVRLMRYFGMIGFDSRPACLSHELCSELMRMLDHQDHRRRSYDELKNSRTVKTAFRIKRWIPMIGNI